MIYDTVALNFRSWSQNASVAPGLTNNTEHVLWLVRAYISTVSSHLNARSFNLQNTVARDTRLLEMCDFNVNTKYVELLVTAALSFELLEQLIDGDIIVFYFIFIRVPIIYNVGFCIIYEYFPSTQSSEYTKPLILIPSIISNNQHTTARLKRHC